MASPLELAGQLTDLLNRAANQLKVAPARLEELAAMRDQSFRLLSELQRFHHEVAPLDDIEVESEALRNTTERWRDLEPGIYRAGNSEAEFFVENAVSLNTLYRAGVNIVSFRKFSEEELKAAKTLGGNFRDWGTAWDRFKLRGPTTKPLDFTKSEAPSFLSYTKWLRKMNVMTDAVFEVYSYRDKKWVEIKPARIKFLRNENQKLRCRYATTRDYETGFFNGLWMNAYAASVVRDHLQRNKVAHEIFTNVEYQAPRDIIAVGGDFDVLVAADHLQLLIECKSGRLADKHGELAEVVDRAKDVDQVLKLGGTQVRCRHVLLFNEHLADEGAVRERLGGSMVLPARIDELRNVIHNLMQIS